MRRRVYLPTNQLFTSGTHAAAAAASSSRIAGADGGDSDEERVIYAEHDCDVYPQKRAATKNPDKSSDVSRNDTANKPILKRPKPKKPLSGVELNGPLEDDNFDLMSGINDIPHNVSFGISSENRYRDDTEVVTHYSEFTRSDVPPAKDTSLAPSNSKEDEDLFSMTCSSSSMPTSSVKNNNISEPANLKPKTIQDIIRADRPAHWGRPKAPASKRIQASAPSKSSATRTLSQAAHLQAPRSAFPQPGRSSRTPRRTALCFRSRSSRRGCQLLESFLGQTPSSRKRSLTTPSGLCLVMMRPMNGWLHTPTYALQPAPQASTAATRPRRQPPPSSASAASTARW